MVLRAIVLAAKPQIQSGNPREILKRGVIRAISQRVHVQILPFARRARYMGQTPKTTPL